MFGNHQPDQALLRVSDQTQSQSLHLPGVRTWGAASGIRQVTSHHKSDFFQHSVPVILGLFRFLTLVTLTVVNQFIAHCPSWLCVCFRLSAEYGGTFLLNRTVNEIVMDNGKVKAVKSDGKARREHTDRKNIDVMLMGLANKRSIKMWPYKHYMYVCMDGWIDR